MPSPHNFAPPQRFMSPAQPPPVSSLPDALPSRGSKRKHDDDDTPLSKRAKTFDKDRVEVFMNKSGNVGVSINGQKFRKKNVRKDSFIVWRCNRNGCQCTAVTTSDHCLVSIGDHCHALPSCQTPAPAPCDPTPIPEPCDPTPAPAPFTPVPVEYIHGGPKHPNVLYKSFKYTFLRTLKSYTLWNCRKPNCHAYIRTADENVTHESGEHNHEPLSAKVVKKMKLKESLRIESAKRPDEKPARLISSALSALKHLNGKSDDHDVSSCRRLIRRVRKKMYRNVPKTKQDTLKDLQSLADDDDQLVRRVKNDIVFIAREKDLRALCDTEQVTIFADGTFKYAPKHFHQMLTIFIFSNGFYIPICHFLLINKLFTSYKACLQILTDECGKLGLNVDISNVMLDFEAGLIKAFKHALPSANVQGCRFHLGQSWWRHIGQLGLAKTYKDASTRDGRWLRRCFSLKMLPADMVEAVFEHSVRLGRLDKAIPFVEYLRKYYIQKDSAFPPTSWAGLTFKTSNNGAESFHRHFGDLFGYLHSKPDIWEFLRTMCIYNELKDTKLNSIKEIKPDNDFWSVPIEKFRQKHISVVKLLDTLSIKCQPKTTSLRKKQQRKRFLKK